jgi:hypothetical protein
VSARYVPCSAIDVPAGVRFNCPVRCQGQIVVVEYGGFSAATHDRGDPFRRTTDQSDAVRRWEYERLADERDEPVRVRLWDGRVTAVMTRAEAVAFMAIPGGQGRIEVQS